MESTNNYEQSPHHSKANGLYFCYTVIFYVTGNLLRTAGGLVAYGVVGAARLRGHRRPVEFTHAIGSLSPGVVRLTNRQSDGGPVAVCNQRRGEV